MNSTIQIFPIGKVIATKNAWHTLNEVEGLPELSACIDRHRSADFGTVDSEDWNTNMRAVRDGQRIMSSYVINGVEVWVITEADRSATTILLPEDY